MSNNKDEFFEDTDFDKVAAYIEIIKQSPPEVQYKILSLLVDEQLKGLEKVHEKEKNIIDPTEQEEMLGFMLDDYGHVGVRQMTNAFARTRLGIERDKILGEALKLSLIRNRLLKQEEEKPGTSAQHSLMLPEAPDTSDEECDENSFEGCVKRQSKGKGKKPQR